LIDHLLPPFSLKLVKSYYKLEQRENAENSSFERVCIKKTKISPKRFLSFGADITFKFKVLLFLFLSIKKLLHRMSRKRISLRFSQTILKEFW